MLCVAAYNTSAGLLPVLYHSVCLLQAKHSVWTWLPVVAMFQTTGGGVADLHPEPFPGRLDDDTPEDDGSVISLPPLATFTRSAASPVPWESELRSSTTSGRRERSGLLAAAENDSLQFSSEGGSRRGGTPPPPEPPVSRAQVAVIGLACFCTFGMGGVVFGISSLYPVLYAQGYWRTVCDEAAASACVGESTKCCEAQLVRYSLVASRAQTHGRRVAQPGGATARHARIGCACPPPARLLPASGLGRMAWGAWRRARGMPRARRRYGVLCAVRCVLCAAWVPASAVPYVPRTVCGVRHRPCLPGGDLPPAATLRRRSPRWPSSAWTSPRPRGG